MITGQAPLVMVKGTLGREEGSLDLEWGLQVGPESSAAALGVDPLAALAEDNVDLDVDQQSDDEGHVEGDDGGVDHEGGVGNDALILVWGRRAQRGRGAGYQLAHGATASPGHSSLLVGTRNNLTENMKGCLRLPRNTKCK